jgi:hypothetical protein
MLLITLLFHSIHKRRDSLDCDAIYCNYCRDSLDCELLQRLFGLRRDIQMQLLQRLSGLRTIAGTLWTATRYTATIAEVRWCSSWQAWKAQTRPGATLLRGRFMTAALQSRYTCARGRQCHCPAEECHFCSFFKKVSEAILVNRQRSIGGNVRL